MLSLFRCFNKQTARNLRPAQVNERVVVITRSGEYWRESTSVLTGRIVYRRSTEDGIYFRIEPEIANSSADSCVCWDNLWFFLAHANNSCANSGIIATWKKDPVFETILNDYHAKRGCVPIGSQE